MNYKELFPIFKNNKELVYLDTAATSQKPKSVLEAVWNYNVNHNANPNRGGYKLGVKSTNLFLEGKKKVADFINAQSDEIVFTKGATESLNLLAYSYGLNELKEGDEILVGITSHHSNLVPWQEVSKKTGCKLKYIHLKDDGDLDLEDLSQKLNRNTKLVTISHGVNTTGVIHPVKSLVSLVREKTEAKIILDVAQTISHIKLDVKELDIDFAVFSGHKMFGPMGIGGLYAKKEIIEKMEPFLFGGDMIEFVEKEDSTYRTDFQKFEGGTQNIEGVVGLSAAIDFIEEIGMGKIHCYENEILNYATEKLKGLEGVKLYCDAAPHKTPVIAFNIEGVHPHDVAQVLDLQNVAIRTGHHCTQPLMKYLEIPSCCRVSFSIYNTFEDIDKLVESLEKVISYFR